MILETFAWVFVDADALEPTCAFYSALLGGEETMRFAYPEKGHSPRSPRPNYPSWSSRDSPRSGGLLRRHG
jgi:hypothetical protein